jgi:hypothetical protein
MLHPRTVSLRLPLLLTMGLAGALTAEDQLAPEPPLDEIDRDYWSFQPVAEVTPPEVSDLTWIRTPIDRFILARLEERELSPLPEADRLTLLRRVSFDLTGLPPSPAEIDRFLTDDRPDAYERLVDRLLESPAYGERWAQHWLDLARFAETDGFEHDKIRPEAWRYRDWVIEALNRDLPYDQFLIRQIAGDELAPDDPHAQLATGFLLAGPDMPDINLAEERSHNFLNGMTATVGEVFLGLQFGCAQCHDHRADPISIHDFYRLRAFFDSIDLFKDHELAGTDSSSEASETENETIKARIARTSAKPAESFVRVRGDFRREGPAVAPAFPRIACPPGSSISPAKNASPRLELARWMASPDNPLTGRVIVNRLWQHHFGAGLCSTASDFGLMGDYPSHPELLDWLARELVENEWSLKAMHRLMVTSSVYRTASRPDDQTTAHWAALVEADPENRLLGRMPRRRLDGESIRDALLVVSGTLNDSAGGPGVRPPLPPEVVQTLLRNQWPVTEEVSEHSRRSIYLFARRNLRFPLLEVFDKPDANQSCSRRSQTTIAPQALHLLNSEFAYESAQLFARRIQSEAETDEERIEIAYRDAFGRPPTADERAAADKFLGDREEADWTDFCLGLINLNEFVYVD